MGLKFKDIVEPTPLALKDLREKVVAIDSMNLLYQFLTTIRSVDGSALTTKEGKVTSHLIGLFSRTTSLMEAGIKLVFVFDGKPPKIKDQTKQLRREAKKQASLSLKKARDDGDIASMKKYASRTVTLNTTMIEDAKKLITYLGLPVVQAPSEGEAQTAYMVHKGDAYASISQDYDNLIFNCPTLVRNLSIAGKRKRVAKLGYQTISPELIKLEDVLEKLEITHDQLIVIAILSGTDYNPGGVKGLGPKKSLKLVKTFKDDFEELFKSAKWDEFFPDLSWQEIFTTIKEMPTTDDYNLEWNNPDEEKLKEFLIDECEFSKERVEQRLKRLEDLKKQSSQKSLAGFFS